VINGSAAEKLSRAFSGPPGAAIAPPTESEPLLENALMATTADDRLRLLIERVERLEEEKKGIADDIRDVYAEAKAVGYDAKIMRQIVRLQCGPRARLTERGAPPVIPPATQSRRIGP
jgi:uncharacterized protein (UPF0335 family)